MVQFEVCRIGGAVVLTVGNTPKEAVEAITRMPVTLVCVGFSGDVYQTPDGRQYIVLVG